MRSISDLSDEPHEFARKLDRPINLPMSRRAWLLAIAILCCVATVELAMGRHPICTCGAIDLWVNGRDSPETSQMVADWYSLSHIVHGLLFYAALRMLARHWPIERRFLAALFIEASWEMIENSPAVIDRYRATAAAIGYNGDSVLNSLSDILFMALGFLLARRLPLWAAAVLIIALELVPLLVIRDNLTLNILNLLASNKSVQAWQAGR